MRFKIVFLIALSLPGAAYGGVWIHCAKLLRLGHKVTFSSLESYDQAVGEIKSRGNISFKEALAVPLLVISDEIEKQNYRKWVETELLSTPVYEADGTIEKVSQTSLNSFIPHRIVWQNPLIKNQQDILQASWRAMDLLGQHQVERLKTGRLVKELARRLYWKTLMTSNPTPHSVLLDHSLWMLKKISLGFLGRQVGVKLNPDEAVLELRSTQDIENLIKDRYGVALIIEAIHRKILKTTAWALLGGAIVLGPEALPTAWDQYQIDTRSIKETSLVVMKDSSFHKKATRAVQDVDTSKLSPEEKEVLKAVKESLE